MIVLVATLFFMLAPHSCARLSEKFCVDSVMNMRKNRLQTDLLRRSKTCVRAYPRNYQILHLRGLVLLETGDPVSASTMFRHAVNLRPDLASNHLYLLRSYLAAKDPLKRYIDVLAAMQSRFQDQPQALSDAGDLLVKHGLINTAYKMFRSLALRKDPDAWQYHSKMGQLHGMSGNWDLALSELEASWELRKDSGITLYYLGIAWENLGRPDYALAYYQRSLNAGITLDKRNYIRDFIKRMPQDFAPDTNQK